MPAPPVRISSIQPERDYALLAVRGAIDRDMVLEVEQELDGLLLTGARYLVVDLSEVTCCDSRAWPMLATADRALGARMGWLRLFGVSQGVHDELDLASLSDLRTMYQMTRPVSHAS